MEVLAGADAEDEAAARQPIHGCCHLGNDAGVVTEQGSGDCSHDVHRGGLYRDGSKGGEGESRRRDVVDPGVKVLRDHHGVETRFLGDDRVLDQGLGLKLLVATEVGELGHARRLLRRETQGAAAESNPRGIV